MKQTLKQRQVCCNIGKGRQKRAVLPALPLMTHGLDLESQDQLQLI